MTSDDFSKAVEDGLRLSKRIYFGKDRSVSAPKTVVMTKKSEGTSNTYLPTSPMIYAVILNPAIVDNPDIPSYQPHVHGRCDPPALIPLQMNGVSLEVDCYLDTALVTVTGSWRVHCIMGSRSCDCRVAIPMGTQGSILGVEIEAARKSISTKIIATEYNKDAEKVTRIIDGGYVKPQILTLTIPQVDGGSNISVKVSWTQKLLYRNGQFTLNIPFKFPEYVIPAGNKISKKEKYQLNVNSGTGTEVLCKTSSHPLKLQETGRHVGKLSFLYESEVISWSSTDFVFSYSVSSSHIFGGILLQSPAVNDVDQREMFCFYLFPGTQESKKIFRKDVVYVVDISGSMHGKPLEDTKTVLSESLSKLGAEDSFNIIAFNGETFLFSSSMELATRETIDKATEWMGMHFVAGGDTNILLPLNKAIALLSDSHDSIPTIFLITDGAVDNERHICDVMKSHLKSQGSICPRIHTFGIGTFCNHYFLRTLAMIGKGQYSGAYDAESVELQMQRLFTEASSTILANIAIDMLDELELEVYPTRIPDLLVESPLILSGRYQGVFPDSVKCRGILTGMRNLTIDLKIQRAKEIPLDRIFTKQQIDALTSRAWYTEDKQLEEKVAQMSILYGILSEYTRMSILETQKVSNKKTGTQVESKTMLMPIQGIGFGNLTATAENTPPGAEEPKQPEAAEIFARAASNCCSKMCDYCCCMCCIKICSGVNNQCFIATTQLCTALACFGCFSCCTDICCCGHDH